MFLNLCIMGKKLFKGKKLRTLLIYLMSLNSVAIRIFQKDSANSRTCKYSG